MKIGLTSFALLGILLLSCASYAQGRSESTVPSGQSVQEKAAVFGPYRAIIFDKSILRDVRVDKELNVHLQLFPAHKDKELVVKISNQRLASYRKWDHGGMELVSPANSGKPAYGWTDWVQVKAKYIEYWMEGKLFLHLMRTDI